MNTDILDEEVDALLKEVGFKSESTPLPKPIQSESLEQLLEEFLVRDPAPSSVIEKKISPATPHRRVRLSQFPIWVSLAILGTFLLGGTLGFYWGRNGAIPPAPSLTSIDEQLNALADEVRKLSKWSDPPPPEEIIEPLQLLQEAIL